MFQRGRVYDGTILVLDGGFLAGPAPTKKLTGTRRSEQLVISASRNLLWLVLSTTLAVFSDARWLNPPRASRSVVDRCRAPAHPFPHFWEHMFGSGRASLSMRDSYRLDLRRVKQATEVRIRSLPRDFSSTIWASTMKTVRGKPIHNFSYVDQVYDGLLQNGVRPFVELSFMPKKLASKRCAACLLVQAERRAAERLGKMGRPDLPVHQAPGGPLRN